MPPSYSKSDHILEQKPLMVALPLCVDLDGTLIRSDMLYEGFCALATDPRVIPTLLLLFRGRAAFKQAVADRATMDPELLPYNETLLAYQRA